MDDLFQKANAEGKSLRFGYKGSKDGHDRVRWVNVIKQESPGKWLCYDLTQRGLRRFIADRAAIGAAEGGIFAPALFDRPGNGYTEDSLPGYTEAAELGLIPV